MSVFNVRTQLILTNPCLAKLAVGKEFVDVVVSYTPFAVMVVAPAVDDDGEERTFCLPIIIEKAATRAKVKLPNDWYLLTNSLPSCALRRIVLGARENFENLPKGWYQEALAHIESTEDAGQPVSYSSRPPNNHKDSPTPPLVH